jgi:hypothetical protein
VLDEAVRQRGPFDRCAAGEGDDAEHSEEQLSHDVLLVSAQPRRTTPEVQKEADTTDHRHHDLPHFHRCSPFERVERNQRRRRRS